MVGHPTYRNRFNRVNIFSGSLVSGTVIDGLYPVELPDQLDTSDGCEFQCAIESFVISNTAPTAPFMVELPGIAGKDQYSTFDGGASCVLATYRGATNISSIHEGIYGSKVDNTAAFRTMFTIRLCNLDGTPATSFPMAPVWNMCLIVFPILK